MSKPDASIPHYAAFISYRHLSPDMEIAEELHKLLEHNFVRPNRNVKRNIRPVCLDKREFPLMADLDEGIKHALEKSECLFVICSPHLQESKYCMREIEYFKKIHGGKTDRIYTLLVDGTPEESFPEILRTKTVYVENADGVLQEMQVEAEPLFADVRANTIQESLRKLRKTEYIRLAAAYFGCSYDSLYQRQKRWVLSLTATITAIVLSVMGGFLAYARVRNREYDTAKANTYASYAEGALIDDDELLALALCEQAYPSSSQQYETTLRSAVVQLDYEKNWTSVSTVMQVPYQYGGETIWYLGAGEKQLLIFDGDICQIVDAKTGMIYRKASQEKIFVNGEKPESYLILESHTDEQGVVWDYVSMYDLEDNHLISQFPYRKADRASSQYRLIGAVETDELLMVSDGDMPVAYLTSQGIPLTAEEYYQLAKDYVTAPLPQDDSPYRVVQKKTLISKKWVVENRSGEVLLELGETSVPTAFSQDWSYFAYVQADQILVYDMSSWKVVGKVSVAGDKLQSIHLLCGANDVIATYLREGQLVSVVSDWTVDRPLLTLQGAPRLSESEKVFYIAAGGMLTRYEYTDFALQLAGEIIAYSERFRLLTSNDEVALVTEQNRPLWREKKLVGSRQMAWTDDLSYVIIHTEEGLRCYNSMGQMLWSRSYEGNCLAMAADGSCYAWLDRDESVMVCDVQHGSEQYRIPAEKIQKAGAIRKLTVSENGVAVVGDRETLWLPKNAAVVNLGEYIDAVLYTDGHIVLSHDSARVYDYQIYDTITGKIIYQPTDNTGAWVYSAVSGYLVRHIETSGNHRTLELDVLRKKNGEFRSVGRIPLATNQVEELYLDRSGVWLTIRCGDRTMVYSLQDRNLLVDVESAVYCEGEVLYAKETYDNHMYAMPVMDLDALHEYANEALTSALGTRTLSEEEMERYSFSGK